MALPSFHCSEIWSPFARSALLQHLSTKARSISFNPALIDLCTIFDADFRVSDSLDERGEHFLGFFSIAVEDILRLFFCILSAIEGAYPASYPTVSESIVYAGFLLNEIVWESVSACVSLLGKRYSREVLVCALI